MEVNLNKSKWNKRVGFFGNTIVPGRKILRYQGIGFIESPVVNRKFLRS